MKRQIFLVILLAFLIIPGAAMADSYMGFSYTILEDNTAEIISGPRAQNEVVIPSEINGHQVTSIRSGAFAEIKYQASAALMKTIIIPESVISIGEGENPFSDCEYLQNIFVSPDNPVFATIDGVLFNKTEKKLVCYPRSFSFASYEIPQGIRIISDQAFCRNKSLTVITIPDSVTNIGNNAFEWCSSLETVTIPDSVTTIGSFAFAHCASLSEVTLPESAVSLGDNPFSTCIKLSGLRVSDAHPTLKTIDGVLFDKTEKKLIYHPHSIPCSSYDIPQGVLTIGSYAFANSKLTSVTIPDSVTEIGDSAFYWCDLSEIKIPGSVKVLSNNVFAFNDLQKVTIEEGVEVIDYKAFENCKLLKNVILPKSVNSIAVDSFKGCNENLTFTLERDSYAVEFVNKNGYFFTYTGADNNDWLND